MAKEEIARAHFIYLYTHPPSPPSPPSLLTLPSSSPLPPAVRSNQRHARSCGLSPGVSTTSAPASETLLLTCLTNGKRHKKRQPAPADCVIHLHTSSSLPPSLPPYLAALADQHSVIRAQARKDKARGGVDQFYFLHMRFVDEHGGELLLGGDDDAVRGYRGREEREGGREGG